LVQADGDWCTVHRAARVVQRAWVAASIPGAVNVQKGEAVAANDDGRLPLQDKGTRVVVFGTTAQQARVVAAEIAKRAYWNPRRALINSVIQMDGERGIV
jgi:rhodanese-related sulfurtransferase